MAIKKNINFKKERKKDMRLINKEDITRFANNEQLDFDNDTNLINILNLDSLGIFNFVLYLEETTTIDFFNNNVDNSDIKTIECINQFIQKTDL